MTKPLALVIYERVLPGGQLVNRLQDMGYRVHASHEASKLGSLADEHKPLFAMIDLMPREAQAPGHIQELKAAEATSHLPVIAFVPERESDLMTAARKAGATVVASDAAIVQHLDRFLQQALHLD